MSPTDRALEIATAVATELDHLQTLLLRHDNPTAGQRCTSCGRIIEARDKPLCPYCRGQMATLAYRVQVHAHALYTAALAIAAHQGEEHGTASEH